MPEHLVIWHIDKDRIESDKQGHENISCSVEMLSERVQRDLKYYNCSRIHSVNGYGCAFLDGNLSDIMLDLLKYQPYLKFKFQPPSRLNLVGLIIEQMRDGVKPLDMDELLTISMETLNPDK